MDLAKREQNVYIAFIDGFVACLASIT
ncbi:protein of unknown function [Shinella sp. WSC3-e]|nr:protein of unknown function [Shinella sp. WSC3-e]